MKITKSRLRQIIKEEVSRILESEKVIVRKGDMLYVKDDEGNEKEYGHHSYFPDLEDGDSMVLGRTPPPSIDAPDRIKGIGRYGSDTEGTPWDLY